MGMEITASLLLFLMGIAALVVIHLCIVGRVFHGDVIGETKIPGRISNEDLKNLPCFNYTAIQTQESTSSADCVVCLDIFHEGDQCRLLPNCNHFFHLQCIDSWLLKTAVCPICRTRVSPSKLAQILNQETNVSVVLQLS
ncbi:RING/U-box superfamily protein [Euphorbia peplus]|nr:RING/U-box superfamily protein [Euphorbia peplus]